MKLSAAWEKVLERQPGPLQVAVTRWRALVSGIFPLGRHSCSFEEENSELAMGIGNGRVGYPAVPQATKGSPGGKLPCGNFASSKGARLLLKLSASIARF